MSGLGFGSSVINKSGKKFAPKVTARRRPGASEATSLASSAEQTPSSTPQPSAESTARNLLPTPPATQPGDAPAETTTLAPASARVNASQQPTPTSTIPAQSSNSTLEATEPLPEHRDAVPVQNGERSPKRQRVELPRAAQVSARGSTQDDLNTTSGLASTERTVAQDVSSESENAVPTSTAGEAGAGFTAAAVAEVADGRRQSNEQAGEGTATAATASANTTGRGMKTATSRFSNQDAIREVMDATTGVTKPSRRLPAQESPQAPEQTEATEETSNTSTPEVQTRTETEPSTRPAARNKRVPNVNAARRRRAATTDATESEQTTSDEQTEAQPGTGETQATTADGQIAEGTTDTATQNAPVKKPRKPRKDKGVSKKRTATEAQNGEDANGEAPKPKRVRRKPAPKAAADGEVATAGDGEDQAVAPRKGPSGISSHLIFDNEDRDNPEKTRINDQSMPMGVLTYDLQMVGVPSNREEALSKIDWDEEKRKRIEERERIAMGEEVVNTQAERDAALAEINEAAAANAPTAGGPRMRLVNGRMILDTSSTQVDRHAQALEDESALQEVEENDLTTRVTSMSWIKANRKDPRERTTWGPTRADRWTDEDTDAFYDALKMFGTDFFIISKMFAGKTRANVKRKFVKEERLAPERIKAALVGETVPMDFELYKQKTGKPDAFFRDPRAVAEELERENEQRRTEIEEAQARHAEMARQKQLAKQGDEGEGKKKKRERKKKKGGPVGGEEIEVVEMDGDELDHR